MNYLIVHQRFLDKALRVMFRCVGLRYSPNKTTEKDWFKKAAWTQREEARFKAWFIKEARKTFKIGKAGAKNLAAMFLLSYGWMERMEKD